MFRFMQITLNPGETFVLIIVFLLESQVGILTQNITVAPAVHLVVSAR